MALRMSPVLFGDTRKAKRIGRARVLTWIVLIATQ